MRVVFRADASVTIGTGHVMRCLTLSEALRLRGHSCAFVCRDLPGHLGALIESRGFDAMLLPAPDGPFKASPDDPAHAHWAGVHWQDDAEATRAVLGDGLNWLVLDHYAFDTRWQRAARPEGTQVMVLDDLADRPHAAALLLDAQLGRCSGDYDPWLAPGAERLIGPRFALLRPEFSAARKGSLSRRAAGTTGLRHIFIFMGGVDLPDVTSLALAAILRAKLPDLRAITVVMGSNAPALAQVQARAQQMPVPTRVLTGVSNIATAMNDADLAIGAGGGTAWERCAVGLPTLMVIIADNQDVGAKALARAGAVQLVGQATDPGLTDAVEQALRALAANPNRLALMAQQAAAITDGSGALRVVRALEQPLRLRPATFDDAETIWNWRQSLPPTAFRMAANPAPNLHLEWMQSALKDPCKLLFMAEGHENLGHLRLDMAAHGAAHVSILLAPNARGQGYAPRLLAIVEQFARHAGCTTLLANIHESNAASRASFEAAGYSLSSQSDNFLTLKRALSPPLQSPA